MENVTNIFKNINAFSTHYEPVDIIYHAHEYWVVPTGTELSSENYIQHGSKPYIEGWLYGCVQAACGQAKRKNPGNFIQSQDEAVEMKRTDVFQINVRPPVSDPLHYTCAWAKFIIDASTYSLFIESDAGNMSYYWQNIGPDSFPHFLAGLEKEYLLRKLSEETAFNFDKTIENLLRHIDVDAAEYRKFIQNMPPAANQYAFANMLSEAPGYHSDDLECIAMDYPAGHHAIAQIFETYIQPELRKL